MPSSSEQAPVSSVPEYKSWDYQIERFSGDEALNEKIGERRVAVDALVSEPLDAGLVADVDQRMGDFVVAAEEAGKSIPEREIDLALKLTKELRGDGDNNKAPVALDTVFARTALLDKEEQKGQLRALRMFANALRQQAVAEKNDMILVRLAEVTRLRVDVAEAGLFLKDAGYSEEQKQHIADTYGSIFGHYAQTDDIPDRFKQLFIEAADSLKKHVAGGLVPEENRLTVTNTPSVAGDVEHTTQARKTEERQAQTEVFVTEKLFGREGGVTAKDVEGIKNHLEGLLAEPSPKSAFEAARVLAQAKRAGIHLAGGRQKMSDFLEGQREEIQRRGPRAFAQYLAYCKYTGLGKEPAPAEGQWLMGAIHERLQKDPTHAGLSRLAMNVRYLNVPGYSPEIVRQGVQEEVEALHQAQKLTEAVEEAARARQAGVEVTGVLVEDRAGMVGAVVARCRDWAEKNQWDKFARLRASADVVWGHTALDEGAKRGLLKYFNLLRFQAEGHGKWEPYVVYAAEVRDLSDRDAHLKEAKGKEISGEQVVEWLEQDLSPDEQHKARNIRIETSQNQRRERERRQESAVRRRENAILTEQEYEEYLGGPEPAVAPQESAEEPDQEAPDWQEVPQEPVVTGGFVRRFWGWLTGRRERRGRSSETPRGQAL